MDRRERGPTFPDNYVCKPLTEKFVFSEVRDMYLKLGLGAIDEYIPLPLFCLAHC
jgi:hypothetical protein